MKFDKCQVDIDPHLTCELWRPNLMKWPDYHNKIVINYLPECSITYLIHNRKVRVREGSVAALWTLSPPQIVDFNRDAPYYVITIPFSILLEWKLPTAFLDVFFKGEVQILPNFEEADFDKKHFQKWINQLEQNDAELYASCLLEICAYLKRFALKSLSANQSVQKIEPPPINTVERMAKFISVNFTEPIKVSDVANEVDLHPDYANAIFKKAFCSTISTYILEQRVLYAQRMLTITSESITSLAYQSGFNSISRFNAAFRKKNNMTPREYRQKPLAKKRIRYYL